METKHASRRVIWGLGVALACSLLVIAFLVGRESSRYGLVEPQLAAAATAREHRAAPERLGEPPSQGDSPFWWERTADRDREPAVEVSASGDARIERRSNGTIVLSNVRKDEGKDRNPATTPSTPERKTSLRPDAPSSVDAYFSRLDAIRSNEQSADPKAFASKLLTAAMEGSTKGFESMIDDVQRMEQEIRAIAPPPSCAQYQETMLEALGASRAVLGELKDAMIRRDPQKIVEVAQKATALQSKTTQLQAMEKQIRAQ